MHIDYALQWGRKDRPLVLAIMSEDGIDQHVLRPGAATRLQSLRGAFHELWRQCDWRFDSRSLWRGRWRLLRAAVTPALFAAGLAVGIVAFNDLTQRFGSAHLALRHLMAAPNCNAARVQGLAPSRRGQPGYYPSHDGDGDGVACEGTW
jgi:hypothetical protein